jgi:predicted  nucleic acid-binding Zn-ribbon protein
LRPVIVYSRHRQIVPKGTPMADDIKKLQGEIEALKKTVAALSKTVDQHYEKTKFNIKDVLYQNDKTLEQRLKENRAEDLKREDVIKKHVDQAGKNVDTLVKKFSEIDKIFKDYGGKIKANANEAEENRKALVRARKYVDGKNEAIQKALEGFKGKIKANANEAEENRKALVRARKYVDDKDGQSLQKIAALKKLMDAMEVRHTKLISTQISNYDKEIRKVIAQEVAKVAKGKR